MKSKRHKYYELNAENIKNKTKEYQNKNKDKIKAKKMERIICDVCVFLISFLLYFRDIFF